MSSHLDIASSDTGKEEDTSVQVAVDPNSDPFAFRPGRTLEWTNVSLSVKDTSTTATATVGLKKKKKQDGEEKVILDSLSGRIAPQQLTAVMGHSGAGKTSLLHVLAGKVSASGSSTINSSITLDGVPIDPTSIQVKRKIAFVAQRDTLLSTATPREAIRFSAKLRLDSTLTNDELDALVDRILKELRLQHVADSQTGGARHRGLSGGEMRRLSLGIELVVRPSLLFCDEVTSGLDSHNATAVMEVLKQVADCGATVLLTIHQPNSRVFGLLDHLILINQGRCMYEGPVDKVPQHFALRGYEVPLNYNPADYILEVSQTESMQKLTEAGFFQMTQQQQDDMDLAADEEDARASSRSLVRRVSRSLSSTLSRATSSRSIMSGSSSFRRRPRRRLSTPKPRLSIFDKLDSKARVSLWTELCQQLKRDIQRLMRDGHAMRMRFMIVVIGSVVTAFAFQGAASTDSIQDVSSFSSHVGAIFFMLVACMVSVQVIMMDQIETRPIFIREFERDHYRILSYGLSKFAIEALISFTQVLILVLTVYWAIGLQGRFWIWLCVFYTFVMIMNAVGIMLAAVTRDVRDAKELIPMTMLPQILFCGYFVSTLPDYMTWLQWLWPLTYIFRLSLNEEFSFCLEKEQVYDQGDHCAQMLLQTYADGSAESIYNNDSLVDLPQTGTYKGTRGILEYFGFFSEEETSDSSFLVNGCILDGSLKVKFNGYEDGICDVSLVEVQRAQVNPILVRDDFRQIPYAEYPIGHRFQFRTTDSNIEGQPTADVISDAVYLPPGLTSVVVNAVNHTRGNRIVCTTLRDRCPASFERDGFETLDDCTDKMGSLPVASANSHGLVVSDNNSTTCRFVHASLAKSNTDHCPHVSYYPEPDKDGIIKCSQSYNRSYADFFTPEDLELFAELAVEYDLDKEAQIVYELSANETRPCRVSFADRENELAASIPQDYVATKTCVEYLTQQNATGENNVQYWLTLAAMYVAIRCLGLALLRNLVTKKSKVA
ncbi:Putative white-brown complex homolog protein 30 [Seminavis robusta]|uniref:White-brown complex homolog protein 30 n=1 Tax=Seminavis robusta TaxID=568900 RepID=A0A9N8DJI6_9STRA|nr:Putative white-brown complex homolog protein 30 [Seminavis robusta]|eukprot:Sro192_g082460.1 Putative white-brown complex homolog protein 30 (1000) ;mRNA; r:24528-27527